jgi:hypothetical protein
MSKYDELMGLIEDVVDELDTVDSAIDTDGLRRIADELDDVSSSIEQVLSSLKGLRRFAEDNVDSFRLPDEPQDATFAPMSKQEYNYLISVLKELCRQYEYNPRDGVETFQKMYEESKPHVFWYAVSKVLVESSYLRVLPLMMFVSDVDYAE